MSNGSASGKLPCKTDWDCLPNEICFVKTTWYEEQLPWPNNTLSLPGCACNTFFKWTGNACDELTSETVFFACCNALMLLSGSISAGLLFRTVYLYYNEDGMATTLLTIPASFGVCLWSFALFASALAVEGEFIGAQSLVQNDPYKGRFNVFGFFGVGIVAIFGPVAAIVISLMWLEIAHSASLSRFVRVESINVVQNLVRAFLVVAFIAVVGTGAIERRAAEIEFNILGYVSAPLITIMIFTYMFGAYKFTKILNETEKRNSLRKASPISTSRGSFMGSLTTPNNLESLSQHQDEQSLEADRSISDVAEPRKSSKMKRNISGFFKIGQKEKMTPIKQVIRIVRNTAIQMCCTLTITMVASLWFTVADTIIANRQGTTAMKEIANPDTSFAYLKFVYLCGELGLSLLVLIITKYVHLNATRRNTSPSPSRSRC